MNTSSYLCSAYVALNVHIVFFWDKWWLKALEVENKVRFAKYLTIASTKKKKKFLWKTMKFGNFLYFLFMSGTHGNIDSFFPTAVTPPPSPGPCLTAVKLSCLLGWLLCLTCKGHPFIWWMKGCIRRLNTVLQSSWHNRCCANKRYLE